MRVHPAGDLQGAIRKKGTIQGSRHVSATPQEANARLRYRDGSKNADKSGTVTTPQKGGKKKGGGTETETSK